MEKSGVVLLVDDDFDHHNLFEIALKEIAPALKLYNAFDGEEALQQLNSGTIPCPDLVFLDLNMPVMDGKECLTKIKQHQNLKHLPIIIYSTSTEQQDIDDTKRLGASHYLSKPNDYMELLDLLSGVLKNQNLQH